MDWTVSQVVIVFLAGLLASFYGTSAGGGALVTVSTFLLLGLSAQEAVATTISGVLSMSITGMFLFHKAGKIDYRIGVPLAAIATTGAVVGSFILLNMPDELLRTILACAFGSIVLLVLCNKQMGTLERVASAQHRAVGYVLFFPIGIYTSVINAGTAILANFVLITCFGQTFLQSAGVRKIIFIVPLLASAVIYIGSDIVNIPFAITLLISQAIGCALGTTCALHYGDKWVRWLFVVVVIVSIGKLVVG